MGLLRGLEGRLRRKPNLTVFSTTASVLSGKETVEAKAKLTAAAKAMMSADIRMMGRSQTGGEVRWMDLHALAWNFVFGWKNETKMALSNGNEWFLILVLISYECLDRERLLCAFLFEQQQ